MIGERHGIVRHIPEEELHAYLDQALSRSQCIEIETHLARCAACRDSRDEIAALRDRTTALLGKVTPRRSVPPPLSQLVLQAEERRRRRSWRRPALWAASLTVAIAGGWALRASLESGAPIPVANLPPIVAEAPASLLVSQPELSTEGEPVVTPIPPARRFPPPPPAPELGLAARTAGTLEVEAPRPIPSALAILPAGLDGRWRQVGLSEAEEATQGLVPLIPELPILGIQVRSAGAQERPLLFVTQRYAPGILVYTVEGPVADVAELVADQLARGDLRSSEPSRSPPDYVESGPGFERTSRVLTVLGRLPADTLTDLARAVVLR